MRLLLLNVLMTGVLALAACSEQHQEQQVAPPIAQTAAADTSQKSADAVPPASTAEVPAGLYKLDREHASLIFRVNHLGFSNYTARFKRFDAKLEFDPRDLAASKVTATVDPASLETDYPNPAKLDFNAQLKGAEWLNVAVFPEMRFESSRIDVTGENTVRINGELTLHGVTRPMVLEARFNGGYAGHPMDPHARIGFSAHGTLKRSQFGIAYGIPAPGTTMGVGDDVNIVIEAEFTGPPLDEKTS
jgi:polyisoprenoid-binding protein YceI